MEEKQQNQSPRRGSTALSVMKILYNNIPPGTDSAFLNDKYLTLLSFYTLMCQYSSPAGADHFLWFQ